MPQLNTDKFFTMQYADLDKTFFQPIALKFATNSTLFKDNL